LFRAETGQLSLASSASSANRAASMPGTTPRTEISLRAIFQPVSPRSNVIVAFTSSFVAGVPFLASRELNAIEKHDAWADASSSSGLVRPLWSSVRDAQVTGRRENAPDDT
jgi:hypothetical protein